MHSMAFRGYAMSGFGSVVDMPPPDWCITTLRSLTTKYEHLSDSRKVKPPFAEAVLNSFKSKLLNFVSSQALYDSDDISDGESEWPMAGDCSAPFIDLKPADYIYDGDALAATSNYLTISPADIVDSAASHCSVAEESNFSADLLAPSPSPASPIGNLPYADSDSIETTSAQHSIGNDDSSDLLVTLPPSIEEALRRFLADSSDQLLSETFTTFADAESSCISGAALTISAGAVSPDADSDDDHHGQFFSESGSSSPESTGLSEDALEFIAAADPVDIFVKNFVANNGSPAAAWDASGYSSPVDLLEAAKAVSDDEEDDESELPPCKRKRRGEAESKDAKAILRNSLPISPRKRSRSVSRRRDAAAVPTSSSSGAESPPPLLNLCISTSADATPAEA
ncbi:hypothetical protein GGF42_003070 [Coemansia sp. RSA 2424]|nr:hypothetical protein GGF42_003070 [Coemansia sp. RSA 2424]